ncbi:MAG: RNA polymerase sigma factor [Planctomycetes bacterium]|nr:RNA polymerase sigma factor [Planctomycetota bacterium]
MNDERRESSELDLVLPLEAEQRSVARPALRLSADDHEELKRLWEENRRWVAALLLTHKPRWADLEDLLQEVATTLVGKGHEIRDAALLKPWLRTVATNVARLAARRGKLRLHGSLDAPDTDGGPENESEPMPSATPTRREEAARLLDLARKLPDGYREPLLLKSVHGLSYRQIGNILGIPETTVETRIARGRKQLREMAEQETKS